MSYRYHYRYRDCYRNSPPILLFKCHFATTIFNARVTIFNARVVTYNAKVPHLP
jgi:hypothetical protein